MEHLKSPVYLDVAAKGLSLAGVALMVLGRGGWFAAGLCLVFIGVLLGAWEMVLVRRVRSPGGPARPAPFGLSDRKDDSQEQNPPASPGA
jgi:drug/metabolite transporter (DMT)-like permease